MSRSMRVSALSMLAAAVLGMSGHCAAQDVYPGKPIRVLQPIPPGSTTDNVIRALGRELQGPLGQPWVVENRPGASMTIGAQACAKAAPDGYTLCSLASDHLTLLPLLFASLPYDPEKDFKPVALLFYNVDGLVASTGLAANSVNELKAFAQANPGKLNFGTLGPGTTTDLFREWIARDWGARITAIPYKGGPQITTALMANEVHITRFGLGSLGGQIKSGLVKVLAVGSSQRSKLLPSVPTFGEAGIGFPIKVWWGLFAPAGTPDAIVNRLNAEIVRIYRDPKFLDQMESQYLDPAAGTIEAFAAIIKTDKERAAEVVRRFGVQKQ